MKNKLYTLSYFRKRLKDAGISSVRLINKFSDDDERYWAILVDPGRRNVIAICYKSDSLNFHFRIITPTLSNFIISTKSMNVIVENFQKILGERSDAQQTDTRREQQGS